MTDMQETVEPIDIIRDIDQLRRDLTGYHGQLVAHNNLQKHCDNQRKRITELEEVYAQVKAENAKLRELVQNMYCDLRNQTFPPDWLDEYVLHMRELGIEVEA